MNKRLMKVAGALLVIVILGIMLAACGKAVGKDTAIADDVYYNESYGNYAITIKLIIGNPDPEGEPLFKTYGVRSAGSGLRVEKYRCRRDKRLFFVYYQPCGSRVYR